MKIRVRRIVPLTLGREDLPNFCSNALLLSASAACATIVSAPDASPTADPLCHVALRRIPALAPSTRSTRRPAPSLAGEGRTR